MQLEIFLKNRSDEIISESLRNISRAHLHHYEESGILEMQNRLIALFDHTLACVRCRQLTPMTDYVEQVAEERFREGFDLSEVQTAINVLEETMWKVVVNEIPKENLAEALGLITTILGIAKDTLACRYVELATHARVRTLNMKELFA